MPDPTKYNLNYRPASYWTTPSDGPPEEQPPSATLVWRYTRRTPLLDPTMDFLPEREEAEVEIACVLLASVTADVISIRARRRGKRIVYGIEDEYGTRFRFKPRTSREPLSMGELIAMIDGATGHLGGDAKGLTSAYRNYNLDGCDAADLVEFVTVSSPFYPEVQGYYEEEAREWLADAEG
jgi:hypothetical protein